MNPAATTRTPRLTLQDGRVVDIRPLEPRDRQAFATAVSRLSDETRYLRFATSKPGLTERELDFLLGVDHHTHEAILAIDPGTRRGVAVVRYVEVMGEQGVVEIAATVADDWQGRGLGRALLVKLVARAREEGYSTLRASVLATNQRAIAILRHARFVPRPRPGILREYELTLGSAHPVMRNATEHALHGTHAARARGRSASRRPRSPAPSHCSTNNQPQSKEPT